MHELELYHPYGFILSSWYLKRFIILYSGLAVLLAIIISVLIYFWIKKRSQRRNTPGHRALKLLAKLKLEDYKQDYKKFYFKLSDIIKDYCAQRYQGISTSLSDKELLLALKNNAAYDQESYKRLQTILDTLQTIKFHHTHEQQDYHTNLLTQAQDFIRLSWGLDSTGILKEL